MIKRKIAKIKLRRGNESTRNGLILDQGELAYIIDKKQLIVGDSIALSGLTISNKNYVSTSTVASIPKTASYGDIIFYPISESIYIVNKDNNNNLILTSIYDNKCYNLQQRLDDLLNELRTLSACLINNPNGNFVWIKQPFGAIIEQGYTFTCTAEAAIYPITPITYRWVNSSGTPILGATTNQLIINSVKSSDANSYACIAESTGVNSITSNYVSLIVTPPSNPNFIWVEQPVGGTVQENTNFTFTASAITTSSSIITYRWVDSFGVAIAGATTNQLNINPVQLSDAKTYACIAESNIFNSITSNYVKLDVIK
jgi:hypothetical protein